MDAVKNEEFENEAGQLEQQVIRQKVSKKEKIKIIDP